MAAVENHLIERLPRKDRSRLLAHCEQVPLELAAVLCDPGKAMRHVYFPIEGFISMVAVVEGSPGVEVGMVGREGMLGAHLALGVATAVAALGFTEFRSFGEQSHKSSPWLNGEGDDEINRR